MAKKGEYIKFRNYWRKPKLSFMIYVYFKINLISEDNGEKIQKSLIQTNIKNILIVVMATNFYLLMISLVTFFKHT